MGDREAAVGVTILSERSVSEGEAKWWVPAVFDAPVARPSEWDNREPGPLPYDPELDCCRDLLRDLCERRLKTIDFR